MTLIQRIDALLPQTQCGKCGHAGCKPYAEGIAGGEAINKCPPGSDETIAALARLLNVVALPLDTERGTAPPQVAFIREAECIGCTKCIQACPVDAIVGAAKLMHTVIADECTGCDLCIAPCPVDCIDMLPLPPTVVPIVAGMTLDDSQRAARSARRDHARQRFEARNARLQREEQQRQASRLSRQQRPAIETATPVDPVQAALARVREQKAADSDAGLKQARVNVTMTRAQLNRSLKAFGHPPTAEQAAQLAQLQNEFEKAEQALAALQNQAPDTATATPASTSAPFDKAAFNRAKIQLAMRRAALNKAQANDASPEQITTLTAEVAEAEQTLKALELAANT
ncbi:electron transport complex subunit RsxB [Pseudomonas sp. NPDC090202]|uniref:electron transport complex subunit RsxB n=1 Tax=unclassified Pseudomonas TaxID=196821 RepID=UPI003824E863